MQNFQLNISETLNDDTQGIFVTVHEPVSTGGKNISAENSSIAAEGSNAGPYCSSFKGLRPYTRYNVYISGCTNPGCGAISESYTRTTEEGKYWFSFVNITVLHISFKFFRTIFY